jgi:hypothetical protein
MMLGSPIMIQAANKDNLGDTYTYAVVGKDPDYGGLDAKKEEASGCGQCYEIEFVDEQKEYQRKPLIAQAFNTQAGGASNFDVYMAAGGYGAFNSCAPDSSFGNTTQSGSFVYKSVPMRDGVTIGSIAGGLRGSPFCTDRECNTIPASFWSGCDDGDHKGYCITDDSECDEFTTASPEYTTGVRAACKFAFHNNYHWNGTVKRVRRVRCPDNLTNVTGLKLIDASLPTPQDEARRGEGWKTHTLDGKGFTTTTMEDCCKPSCSNAFNVTGNGIDKSYNVMYSCDSSGSVYKDKDKAVY